MCLSLCAMAQVLRGGDWQRALCRLRGGALGDPGEVDEGLYSRQLYVLGHAAQRSLATSAILIVGLTGVQVGPPPLPPNAGVNRRPHIWCVLCVSYRRSGR